MMAQNMLNAPDTENQHYVSNRKCVTFIPTKPFHR